MLQAFKNYFAITKKEWNGIIVLLLIITIVLVSPAILGYFHKDKPMDLTTFKKTIAQLKSTPGGEPAYTDNANDNKKLSNPTLFKFNPNNLPDAQWQKLGLSPHQIAGIKNYESKGGHFYTKADVQKMYTLTPEDYTRLEPYIDLPVGESKVKKGDIILEINTADSAKLTELKGIGPSFAARIVSYRKQLGGFISKEQLKEIYGVDSAKYAELSKQITVNPNKITRIDINKATVDDLRRFPYLEFKQMNAIVEYRKQHGNYQSANDLHEIVLLNDEIVRKIAPYLKFK